MQKCRVELLASRLRLNSNKESQMAQVGLKIAKEIMNLLGILIQNKKNKISAWYPLTGGMQVGPDFKLIVLSTFQF